MAKDKKGSKAAAPKSAASKPLDTVKAGRVTKPIEQSKAAAKDVVKKAANGVEKTSKKIKKAAAPESDDDSDTSASSDSSDEEVETKLNGKAKKPVEDSSDEESDDGSDSDSGSSDASDSEDEVPKKEVPVNGNKVAAAASDSGDSDDDSESSGSDSDDEPAVKAGANGTHAADDSSDGSSSDSEEDSDESEDEDDKPAPKADDGGKKRKAEHAIDQTPKKIKVSVDGEMKEATANLFVGNISWNVDEEWLYREFEEIGDLASVRIITDRESGRSKGFGYVEFSTAEKAAEALEAKQGMMLDGREIRLDFSTGRQNRNDGQTPQQRSSDRAQRFGDVPKEPTLTLFVGNISFNADESMVSELFQDFGSISSVRLPTDRETGALKGFGYVEFSSVDEAKAAYEGLQGGELDGRPIRLDYSTPRSTDSPRGGGFSRGGDRGRGGFRGDRGGRGGRGGGRGGFNDRGRGGARGGRGGTTNRGGFGDFSGKKMTF